MTVFRSLFRNVENPSHPLTSTALIELLGGKPVIAGTTVNEESALAFSAVYRCVSLISGTIASLPLKTYDRISDTTRDRVHLPLVERPHPDLTSYEFWEILFVHALLWGNAYAYKRRDQLGRVVSLWPLLPSAVTVERDDPTEPNPSGKTFTVRHRNGQDDFTPYEVFHVPGMGYDGTAGKSVIGLARQGIGLGLAMEEYGARFFGSGALMSGILNTDATIKDEKVAEAIQKRFQNKLGGLGRAHEVAVLDRGLKFQSLSMPHDDAQFLESRRFQLGDIARFFGVPPHMIGDVERSTSWGAGIESQTTAFYITTLRPWLTRFEQRVTFDLLEKRPFDLLEKRPKTYAEFDIDGILRADLRAQADAMWRAVGRPWKVPNEVRPLENLGPADGGDVLGVPAGMTLITPEEEAPAEGVTNGQVPAAAQG